MSRFVLVGLPGENPLGFMAALGTLLTAERVWPDGRARLSWALEPVGWRPALELDVALDEGALLAGLLAELKKGAPAEGEEAAKARRDAAAAVRDAKAALNAEKKAVKAEAKAAKLKKPALAALMASRTASLVTAVENAEGRAAAPGCDETAALGQNLRMTRGQAEPHFRRAADGAAPKARRTADMLAGFACEAAVEDGSIGISKLSKQNGNSGKHMLADVLSIRSRITADSLRRSLFASWDYGDEKWSLGWDPADVRPYAHQASDPAEGAVTMHGANLLAYEAFAMYPVGARGRHAETTGTSRIDGAWQMSWPLWTSPLPAVVVRSLVAHPALQAASPDSGLLAHIGVAAVFRAEHFAFMKKSPRFRPARPV